MLTDTTKEARRSDVASLCRFALIMAGGSGLRAGGGVPKQMRPLAGIPMIVYPVRAFLQADADTQVVVVMNPACRDAWEQVCRDYPDVASDRVHLCAGGADRLSSVASGLRYIESRHCALDAKTIVAVHDAARPMVTPEVIARGWATAQAEGSAVPVVPLSDSIREVESDGSSQSADRSRFRAVQTPQVFRGNVLADSYSRPLSEWMTDDASVCQNAGYPIALYEGDPANIKVTNPTDFVVAEALLASRNHL